MGRAGDTKVCNDHRRLGDLRESGTTCKKKSISVLARQQMVGRSGERRDLGRSIQDEARNSRKESLGLTGVLVPWRPGCKQVARDADSLFQTSAATSTTTSFPSPIPLSCRVEERSGDNARVLPGACQTGSHDGSMRRRRALRCSGGFARRGHASRALRVCKPATRTLRRGFSAHSRHLVGFTWRPRGQTRAAESSTKRTRSQQQRRRPSRPGGGESNRASTQQLSGPRLDGRVLLLGS